MITVTTVTVSDKRMRSRSRLTITVGVHGCVTRALKLMRTAPKRTKIIVVELPGKQAARGEKTEDANLADAGAGSAHCY